MPMFARMEPAPKTALMHFQAGVHSYWTPETDLPVGVAPGVRQDLARGGYGRILPLRERRQRLMAGGSAKLEYTTQHQRCTLAGGERIL